MSVFGEMKVKFWNLLSVEIYFVSTPFVSITENRFMNGNKYVFLVDLKRQIIFLPPELVLNARVQTA